MKHILTAALALCSLSIAVLIGTRSMSIGLYAGLITAVYLIILFLNPDVRKATRNFFRRSGTFGTGNKYYGEIHLKTLQEDIEKIEPLAFEHFIGDLFAARGYKTKVTPETKDFGADVIAKKGDQCIVIQVKHRDSSDWLVSNDAVQQAVAAMPVYKANKSMVVTNGTFTEHAYTHAGYTHTVLINGEELFNMVRDVIVNQSRENVEKTETEDIPIVLEDFQEVKLEKDIDKTMDATIDQTIDETIQKTVAQNESEKSERKKS